MKSLQNGLITANSNTYSCKLISFYGITRTNVQYVQCAWTCEIEFKTLYSPAELRNVSLPAWKRLLNVLTVELLFHPPVTCAKISGNASVMHSDIIIDSTAGQCDYKHATHGVFFKWIYLINEIFLITYFNMNLIFYNNR